jgi:hypothetical protein
LDGVTAIAAGPSNNKLYVSNGTNTFQTVAGFNLVNAGQELSEYNPSTGSYTAGFAVADFNGDGRHDILRWKDSAAQNTVYLSNGDGTFSASSSFNLTTGNDLLKHSARDTDFLFGDFTGRGSIEILRLKNAPSTTFDSTRNQLFVKVDSTPSDLLSTIRAPSGSLTTLSYLPLSNSNSGLGPRYVSDRDAANTSIHPKVHLTVPIHVVVTSQADSGVGSATVATEYSYKGLKGTYSGRGSVGFSEIRRQSPGANGEALTVSTRYLQDYPYVGVASSTETRRGQLNNPSAPLISSTTYVYCEKAAPPGAEDVATATAPCPVAGSVKVQKPYLRKSIESGFDLNGVALPSVTTVNTFNGSGDPTSIVVTTTGTVAGINETYTKTTMNVFNPDNTAGDNWILGRLQRSGVRSQVPNSLSSIATSAGTAPNATATTGTSPALPVDIVPEAVGNSQTTAGTVSATASVTVTDYPTPPITYTWERVPVGGGTTSISANPSTGTSNNVTFSATVAFGQTISERFKVTARDAAGRTGTDEVQVSLTVTTSPMTLQVMSGVSASRNNPGPISTTASVGTLTSNNVRIQGGLAAFTYNWTPQGPRVSVTNPTSATPTLSANLGWGENVNESVQVQVTDSVGQVRTASITVNFTSPAAPSVGIGPSSLTISSGSHGGTASGGVTASASGGVPPYTYGWSRLSGSRIGVAPTSGPSVTFSSSVFYDDDFTEWYRVTATDSAGNPATADIGVRAMGPAMPAPSIAVSPTSHAFGTVSDGVTVTQTFTVTNSGGPGVIAITLVPTNGGLYSTGARTCPANGATMSGFSSCTIEVRFTGTAQCGGPPASRPATLTATVGSSSGAASISATDRAYTWTQIPCR